MKKMPCTVIAFIFLGLGLPTFSQNNIEPCDSGSTTAAQTKVSVENVVPATEKKEAADVAYQIPDINLVGFGGAWANPKNMNNAGSWNGVYVDIGLTKQELALQPYSCWQIALFGVASWSRFEDNQSYYSASSQELGGGIAFGYYSEALLFRPVFAGLSLGIHRSSDEGKSVRTSGIFRREQADWLVSVSLNLQLISRVSWFNRTQLEVKWEAPITTSVSATWNQGYVKAEIWNREYFDALLKQSVLEIPYNQNIHLSPKLLLRYSYAAGDDDRAYGIGLELGIKKIGQDDFISLYYIFNASKTISLAGAKINFALL